jgi:hypothetical protein
MPFFKVERMNKPEFDTQYLVHANTVEKAWLTIKREFQDMQRANYKITDVPQSEVEHLRLLTLTDDVFIIGLND